MNWTFQLSSVILVFSYLELPPAIVWPVLISDHQWWMENVSLIGHLFRDLLVIAASIADIQCHSRVWSLCSVVPVVFFRNSIVFHRGLRRGVYLVFCDVRRFDTTKGFLIVWDSLWLEICWTVLPRTRLRSWSLDCLLFLSRCLCSIGTPGRNNHNCICDLYESIFALNVKEWISTL